MFHAADGFPVKPQTPFPASNQANKSEHNKTCELTVLCLEAQNSHRQIND